MEYDNINVKWPPQKKSLTSKTKKWRKQHLDWADNNSQLHNFGIRKSFYEKRVNFDLYSGITHISEMKVVLNPFDKEELFLPSSIPHYPVLNSAVNILIGEESNRRVKLNARAINPEAISLIEEQQTEKAHQKILEFINSPMSESPTEEQQKVSSFQQYLKYSLQDIEEINDNYILQHYMKEVDFDEKLREGFKYMLLVGEDGPYQFDIISGEPVLNLLDPNKVWTYRSSGSQWIQDSDIIVIENYKSPGKLIDDYYEDLTETDQKYLEDITLGNDDIGDSPFDRQSDKFIRINDINRDGLPVEVESIDGVLGFAYAGGMAKSDYTDGDGNIRELKIYWKSKRKLLKIKSYNLETGEPEYRYESELYVPDDSLGEESEILWVNEIWEGTKIGKDIYIKMRPKPVQFRRLNNISECHAGIVGRILSTNKAKPYSYVDQMKPYQYLWDVVHDRLIKLMANHRGELLEIDLAKIPSKFTTEQWFNFVNNENIIIYDSFKEGNKGSSTGKLAGNMNTTGKSVSLDLSASIKLYVELLGFISNTMKEFVGITPQRMGEVSNRETVGGVERSVTQSSHTTAEAYVLHDTVKIKCAEALLQTAKIAMKGKNKKVPFVTVDGLNIILEIDGDNFSSKDHGIFIESDLDQNGLRQKLEQMAFAWSQNETVLPSTILKIMTDPSLTSIQRKIEQDIADKQQRDAQAQQSAQESQERMIQMQQEEQERANQIEMLRLELDDLKSQRENETKLTIAGMGLEKEQPEDNSIDVEKIRLQKEKIQKDFDLRKRQLAETERHNKAAETIQRSKPNKTK